MIIMIEYLYPVEFLNFDTFGNLVPHLTCKVGREARYYSSSNKLPPSLKLGHLSTTCLNWWQSSENINVRLRNSNLLHPDQKEGWADVLPAHPPEEGGSGANHLLHVVTEPDSRLELQTIHRFSQSWRRLSPD